MTLFTTDLIMSWHPCRAYPRERVSQICGDHGVTAKYLALQTYLPILDRIWALVHGLPNQERRLFSIDCIERASEHLDDQMLAVISVVRQYVFGMIDKNIMDKISDDVSKMCRSLTGPKLAVSSAIWWITSIDRDPKIEWNAVWQVNKCLIFYCSKDQSSFQDLDVEQAWQLDRLLEWYDHGDVLIEEHRLSCEGTKT